MTFSLILFYVLAAIVLFGALKIFSADFLYKRHDLDANASRILGHYSGTGLRWCGYGVIPICCDDA